MVLTSHALLDALVAAVDHGVGVTGIYDAGQMDPIFARWNNDSYDAAVLADFHTVASHLSAKHSEPYSPTGLHTFMHDKILVTGSQVTTGSYNSSANAERNAENQLHLTDPTLITRYTAYLAALTAAYAT